MAWSAEIASAAERAASSAAFDASATLERCGEADAALGLALSAAAASGAAINAAKMTASPVNLLIANTCQSVVQYPRSASTIKS